MIFSDGNKLWRGSIVCSFKHVIKYILSKKSFMFSNTFPKQPNFFLVFVIFIIGTGYSCAILFTLP